MNFKEKTEVPDPGSKFPLNKLPNRFLYIEKYGEEI